MGKLIRLELYNFKSYKGHHVLLFGDAFFTSIIGPNGSGKSNSMDAISFVLGVKSSHLRSAHLKELIYRGRVIRRSIANGDAAEDGQATQDDTQQSTQSNDPKSAWVMAVYSDDAAVEHRWKRTITPQGASEYRINDRVVTQAQYAASMEEENILIKARNFLVFQGEVEEFATKKPQDLTRLVEQVSGSLEYKTEYDRLKVEQEEANDQQSMQVNRRRGINAEIRQFREQKDEADRFERKTRERDDAIVRHMLWKLYHLQQEIEESQSEIQKHQNDLQEFNRTIQRFNKAFDSARKEYIQADKEVSNVESSIKTQEKQIEVQNAKLIPITEQITVSGRNLTKYGDRVSKIQTERQKQADQLVALDKQLKVVERAQAKFQTEQDQLAQRGGGQLTQGDLQEYNRLRGEVAKRASADQSRLTALKTERAPQEATYNNLRAGLESAEARLTALQEDENRLTDRKRLLEERNQQIKQDRDDKRRALNTLTAEKSTTARIRTEQNEKLQDILRKLIEADDGKQASRKEMKIQETIATLKRTYPGVRGRLHELCTPKQKKFQEAMGVVLGRHFDSVVVDTEAIAKQCIEFLRDQRAGQATFIPLDTIQAKNTGALKGLDAGVRLAIDTISFNSEYQRAVSYACGNAIVCDDLDVAKRMVYQKNVEAKAVTLDGTVIHKGGLITGGRGERANTRRWDEAEVERLTNLKDRILSELEALPKERVRDAEEQTLQQDLKGLEAQVRELDGEIEALDRNISSKKAEIRSLDVQIKQDRPKVNQEKTKLDEFEGEIGELAQSIGTVEDEVFDAFCQRLGFENIGDYEARQGSLQQEVQRKKVEFITQKGKLEGQINYERTQLQSTDDRITALQDKEARDRETIDELNEQKRGIDDDLQAMKETLDELNATLEEAKEARSNVQNKQSKARSELQQRSKKNEHVLKAISDAEIVVKRQAADRYAVLRRCKIENIKIPLLEDSEPLDVLPITDAAPEGEDQDSMDVDQVDDPTPSALQARQIADYGIVPDYGVLDDDIKEDKSSDQDGVLQEAISRLEGQLSKLTPNSHAAARLEAAEERLANTDAEYKSVQQKYSKLSKEYNNVKDARNELFNKAFLHISEQIGPIYANLTRSSEFPAGGQAYLTADADEPYLAGINYTTMPPAKRFRDMEHLSGGEKTMAALALLFAIHSYQPSPFFVLDEVDAALDNANVQKLVRYVQEHAAPGMQFIVISLKTGFFQGSEALVGIYRDQSANSSKSLTLDLRKYG